MIDRASLTEVACDDRLGGGAILPPGLPVLGEGSGEGSDEFDEEPSSPVGNAAKLRHPRLAQTKQRRTVRPQAARSSAPGGSPTQKPAVSPRGIGKPGVATLTLSRHTGATQESVLRSVGLNGRMFNSCPDINTISKLRHTVAAASSAAA